MLEIEAMESKEIEKLTVENENLQFIASYLAGAIIADKDALKEDAVAAYKTLDISPGARLTALATCVKGLVNANYKWQVDNFVLAFLNIPDKKEEVTEGETDN